MKNFKEFCKINKEKIMFSSLPALALLNSSVFAAEGNQTATAVTSALQSTAANITSSLNAIAPIGLGIAGTFLVWRYGMRFFKSLSK